VTKTNNPLIFLLSIMLLAPPLLMNQWGFVAEFGAKILGAIILFILVISESYKGKVNGSYWLFLFFSIFVALLYLIPLPDFLWEKIPGREAYIDVSHFVEERLPTVSQFKSLSIIPQLTENSVTMLLPMIAVFVATLSLHSKQLKKLLLFVFVMAGFQAVLGLSQYFMGTGIPFLGVENVAKNATGTYVNRDHYAGLLELILPLSLGMMMQSINSPSHSSRFQLGANGGSKKFSLLFILSFLILLAVFYSRSRMGIVLTTFTVFITFFVFSRKKSKRMSLLLGILFIFLLIAIMSLQSIVDIAFRFFMKDLSEENRFEIYAVTLEGIKALAPFGSGPGTFANIFKAFQPHDMQFFINSAHNDYLELIFETGIFGIIIIVFFFILFVRHWIKLNQISSWAHQFRYTQTAAGLGMLILLIHALVDFNFHVDANMIYFSFFAGLFFHFREKDPNGRYKPEARRKKSRKKNRRVRRVVEGELLS